jgi:hypothetical protein
MTHDEAKKSMAAEAYILDDLEPAERNGFEEHFFDCTDCTADVLDAAAVADGMRTETTNVVPFRHYREWAAAAAAAVAITIGVAYLRPKQPTPPRPPAASISTTAAEQVIELDAPRAAQSPYSIVGKQSVSVAFIIPVTDPHPPYVCELRDDAGHIIGSKTVRKKEEAAEAVSLVIPAGKFRSGNYKLGIRGDREIPPYNFAVEVQ